MIDEEFWRGKRVFLTGHTGFKGSWISIWLSSLGAQVHGYALAAPTTPALFEQAHVAQQIDSELGDVCNAEQLTRSIAAFQPEIIIHMAAQPLVRASYQNPVLTYATNVMGTVHVLEAARQVPGVRAVVVVTTDKCYENREWEWGYRECEPMGGHDPYSNSKGCAELVTDAYRRSFFAETNIAIGSARAGNVIGGGDWAEDRLIPDILKAFQEGRSAVVRNPHAIRPWQHVLEPLSGYLLLAETLYTQGQDAAKPWNFGPHDDGARPVDWIAGCMSDLWGDGASWELMEDSPQPHEATYLKLDISRARTYLGWSPTWTLQETLGRIVNWQRAWLSGSDVQQLCLDEIAHFRRSWP
jgi:CDP-glucose 4,6-dehydratase